MNVRAPPLVGRHFSVSPRLYQGYLSTKRAEVRGTYVFLKAALNLFPGTFVQESKENKGWVRYNLS